MNLIRKQTAFQDFDLLFNDFFDDSWFNGLTLTKTTTPSTNIKETEKSFEMEVAAPGMNKEDFKAEIENGYLIISCETKKETEDTNDNYSHKEFNYSSFKRSFKLPDNTETKEIDATYKDGILKLTIPKIEKKKINNLIEIK